MMSVKEDIRPLICTEEKTLETPWTVKRSILKEINPEYSLEGMILKLKHQYFGYVKG